MISNSERSPEARYGYPSDLMRRMIETYAPAPVEESEEYKTLQHIGDVMAAHRRDNHIELELLADVLELSEFGLASLEAGRADRNTYEQFLPSWVRELGLPAEMADINFWFKD